MQLLQFPPQLFWQFWQELVTTSVRNLKYKKELCEVKFLKKAVDVEK